MILHYFIRLYSFLEMIFHFDVLHLNANLGLDGQVNVCLTIFACLNEGLISFLTAATTDVVVLFLIL